MSTTSLVASSVMDLSASLMNDTAKTVYTYTAQLPYLKMALNELQEEFELNNIPVTNATNIALTVVAGTTSINPIDGTGAGPAPNYPDNLIEVQQLWERLNGSSEPYIPVSQSAFLPHNLDDITTSELQYWAFKGQRIVFIAASSDRQVKIDYVARLFPDNINENTLIGLVNAESFLMYRTAGLCSAFIGENQSRADALNSFAEMARDRAVGISTKGKQSNPVRRRPFMASYKRRTFM
jgi:hypothetical protein